MNLPSRFLRPKLVVVLALSAASLLTSEVAAQGETDPAARLKRALSVQRLDTSYRVSRHLSPYYLRGDFDGDGRLDVAVLIQEVKRNKVGIGVVLSKSSRVFILGAGHAIGRGGDDFNWMDSWSVYSTDEARTDTKTTTAPRFHGMALLVEKRESAGGIIYWDGARWVWLQHGD